jgi:hypothetical protein
VKLDWFVHRCIVREGAAAGNKVATPVKAADFEYGNTCEHCGEPLATPEQILAHIYEELTQ